MGDMRFAFCSADHSWVWNIISLWKFLPRYFMVFLKEFSAPFMDNWRTLALWYYMTCTFSEQFLILSATDLGALMSILRVCSTHLRHQGENQLHLKLQLMANCTHRSSNSQQEEGLWSPGLSVESGWFSNLQYDMSYGSLRNMDLQCYSFLFGIRLEDIFDHVSHITFEYAISALTPVIVNFCEFFNSLSQANCLTQ